MSAISDSMRKEFEKRALYILLKSNVKELSVEQGLEVIHQQTDKIIEYEIQNEDLAIQFLELSFRYPILQANPLGRSIDNILRETEDEFEKIEVLANLLNQENYVS
ncbi:hypothetical protein [Dysgonomonas sp. ZJ279]|uniref:hypothetical protein n=1 Tax=Dysgonomonas sp. ZJ279 TaxID=2709796 RepID=UPI0013EBAF50|nr:hypothetical protein [Dysgonomonas sp. ZJ279]